jgi:hypothetical protein
MVGNWSSAHLVSCMASTSISARAIQSTTRSTRARIEFTFHVANRMAYRLRASTYRERW